MTKNKNEKAIATTDPNLPAHLQGVAPEGMDQIDKEDLSIARLKVGNPMSNEVMEGDVKNGDLFDSVSGAILPAGSVGVIIGLRRKRNKWKDKKMGNGIDCVSEDGKRALGMDGKTRDGQPTDICAQCVHSEWRKNEGKNIPPACTEYREFLFLPEGDKSMPMVISMGKSTAKQAKKLVQKLNADMGTRDLPIYAFAFKLSSRDVQRGDDRWWELDVDPAGYADEALFARGKEYYDEYKNYLKRADVQNALSEDGPTEAVLAEEDTSGPQM